MYRIIAHNPTTYKVSILHEYTKITKESNIDDIYMDMTEPIDIRYNPIYKMTWIDDEDIMINSSTSDQPRDAHDRELTGDPEIKQMDLPDSSTDERGTKPDRRDGSMD